MAVSSNTLFHFTRKMCTLKQIIQDRSFWPKYCEEKGWNVRFAVPITCFCDIPLSQIGKHIEKYGSFGLGMSKEWGQQNGVSPVFYITPENFKLFKFITNNGSISKQECVRMILPHIKRYEYKNETCSLYRNGCNYVYYDEREWRYIPKIGGKLKAHIQIKQNTNLEEESKNTKDEKYRLHFNYSDIRYLFVDNDENRYELLKFLDDNISKNGSKEQCEILKSKIVTKEQLTNDF